MKKLKWVRNLWIFAGLCFLLGMILFISDGIAFDLRYIFSSIAIIASFINAYNTHKKITKKED
jgi:hypothetical protein